MGGRRYEVHHHHPPLIYGRSADCEPETSTGIALLRVDRPKESSLAPCYALITFKMPHLTAQMVPRLQRFAHQHLAAQGG